MYFMLIIYPLPSPLQAEIFYLLDTMWVRCLTDKPYTLFDISSRESLRRAIMGEMIEVGDDLSLKKYRFTEEILTEKRMLFFWYIRTFSEPIYNLFFYIIRQFLHILPQFSKCLIYGRIDFSK